MYLEIILYLRNKKPKTLNLFSTSNDIDLQHTYDDKLF